MEEKQKKSALFGQLAIVAAMLTGAIWISTTNDPQPVQIEIPVEIGAPVVETAEPAIEWKGQARAVGTPRVEFRSNR